MRTPSQFATAYELGRSKRALADALPLLPPVIAAVGAGCWLEVGSALVQGVVAPVLLGAFLFLRWRGLELGRGAMYGLAAGALPLLVPTVLAWNGMACDACPAWCRVACAVAGGIGGVILGSRARTAKSLGAGAVVATLAALLGCWPMGAATLAGMLVALAVGSGAARAAT